MKRGVIFLVFALLIFSSIFVFSEEVPNVDQSQNEVESIQKNIDEYVPINENGEFDPSAYKSKAELRIEKINEYVGPFSKALIGIELSMSWVFVFSLVVWILLIEFFVMLLGKYLRFNIVASFVVSILVAVFFMRNFGPDLVDFMDTTLWNNIILLGFLVIGGVIYSIVMHIKIKQREKKEKEEENVNRKAFGKLVDNAVGS
jgi:hypothetical protein